MLQRLNRWLWISIVLSIVLVAVYSSFGRLLMSNLGRYQEQMLASINARLNFTIEVDELRGSWHSLSPRLEANGVRILGDGHAQVGLRFDSILLELDVLDTVRTLSPRLYTLTATGGRIHVDVNERGELRLAGMAEAGEANISETLNDFIFNADELRLGEMAVEMHDAGTQRVSYVEAELQRDGSFRRFLLSLRAPDRQSWFRLTGEGNGELSSFRRFSGLFHLQASIDQLSLYDDLLAQADLEPRSGSMESQLWLKLERGEVSLAAELMGRDIELAKSGETDSSLAFEQIELDAAADYVDGSWQFRARDMNLQGRGESIMIDRLAGSWGNNSLSLRLMNLELGTLSRYLERAGLLPDTAADVLARLSPEGKLERVEFSLDDLEHMGDWRLSTNFHDVDVEPWKGAPGLTHAAGYADLGKDGGRVQLASSDFSMSFPTVFKEPLSYHSFAAELEWYVEDDAFRIRSGPFTARAEEGEVRGLFSMQLPRVEAPAGAEMDLLVSLKDTAPVYRRKYLPYTLSPGLLEWLEPGIGEGAIREGGFIFRGALKQPAEYRTVQLYFDVEETRVDYHPQWPAAEGFNGLVLINDADVDVYADKARILNSSASDIVMQLRSDKRSQLWLSLDASMSGPAADGLEIVNTSPLRQTVGDTFVGWRLDGTLETRLKLKLNLSDRETAPEVELHTEWQGVEVALDPLNLTIENLSGVLDFASDSGFSASGVTGTLWGEAITGTVTQGLEGGQLGELDIALDGPVTSESIRDWLELDLLRLATGRTNAELHVLIPPTGGPRLTVNSTLEGVALDLPSPWAKAADSAREFTLQIPLNSGPRRLLMAIDSQAYLGVDLDEQGFSGGSLGFGSPLQVAESGRFLLGGKLASMDWDEWQAFIDVYLSAEETDRKVLTTISDLELGELRLFDRLVHDVLLSGQETTDDWRLDFATDWVAGRVSFPVDFSHMDIKLDRLDVSSIDSLYSADGNASPRAERLPQVDVAIEQLSDGDHPWGNLGFALTESDSGYHLENIRGKVRGLQLGNDEAGMRLDWLGQEADERSRLAGSLEFENFGDVLAEYQYEEIVETKNGKVTLDLAWPGAPQDFQLISTSGSMEVDVGEGRFLSASGTTSGTLRVVSILNLADFVSRLSLDLSYLYESGVPFDSIKGELDFQRGMIDVSKIDVLGRSSRFQFAGMADARESTINGELVATLPIASNLPWMLALVSGLPAAAGVYVISKLFSKQMNRFSSAVYRVDGPWEDPAVNFERIFDDSTQGAPAGSAESGSDDGEDAAPASVESSEPANGAAAEGGEGVEGGKEEPGGSES